LVCIPLCGKSHAVAYRTSGESFYAGTLFVDRFHHAIVGIRAAITNAFRPKRVFTSRRRGAIDLLVLGFGLCFFLVHGSYLLLQS
jgi:hypothetical protein